MWSTSQRPGGAGAPREDAGAVAQDRPVRGSGRGSRTRGATGSVLRSMTGLMVTFVRVSPHQPWTWSSRTRRWPFSIRPVGPKTVSSPTVVASKWAWMTTSRATGSPSSVADRRRRLGRKVECGLGAGEVPSALARRASRGSAGSEGLLRRRAWATAWVEVEGVGDVELGLDPQGPGEVDVLVVDGDVARVDVQVAVLRVSGRVSCREVVALDGLGDESVELRGADLAGDGSDLRVDPPGCLERQSGCGVDRGLRDEPRTPGGHVSGLDLCPESGEAVAELEGVTDELLRRRRRDAEDGPSSATQNSATSGQPSPAMGSSCSHPGTVKEAAEWMDSGGWRSAQRAARRGGRRRRWSSAAFRT